MSNLSGVVNFVLFTGLASLGPIVALILIAVRAHGRIRAVGLIGSVLLIISTVGGGLLSLFVPAIRQRFDLSYDTIGVLFLPTGILGWAGTIALGLAVVIRSRVQSRPAGYPVGQQPMNPGQPPMNPGQR